MTDYAPVARFWSPLLPHQWIDLHEDGTLWMVPAINGGERAARPFRGSWRSLRAPETPTYGFGEDRVDGNGTLLTASQAANILGVTPQRVSQLIAEGRLPSYKIGAERIVCARDLAAVSERKRTGRRRRATS